MDALTSIKSLVGTLAPVSANQPVSERKPKLLHSILLIGLSIYGLYIPLIFMLGWYPLIPTHIAGLAVLGVAYYLNQTHQFNTARWLFSIGMIAVMCWTTISLQAGTGVNYFQLLFAVLPLTLFNNMRHSVLLFVLSLVAFLGAEFFHTHNTPLNSINDPVFVQANRAALFAALFLVLYYFKSSVDEHITALKASKERLEQRNRDLEVMTRAVSHDLKTPIRNISHLASWIEEDNGEELPTDTRDRLVHIQKRTSRMEHLINDLLEYSNIGQTGAQRAEWVNLDTELREMAKTYAEGTSLTIQVDGQFPNIKASALAMYQVFHNLLDNAIRHHHNDSGTVTISYARNGDTHRFSVCDDGPGIEAQFHEKIFDVFQTLHGKDEEGSTGIGLSIVKRNVEQLHGSIELESAPGQGSCFTVVLPV